MATRKPSKHVAETAVTFPYSLESVIAATKADSFVYTAVAFHKPLVESGDVEVNPTLENENGEFATRATAKHLNLESSPVSEVQTATAAKPAFVIETGLAIPEKVRATSGLRAGRTAIYPFDALEINQSFFVPNREGVDKDGKPFAPAAKALASTVNAANARYAVAAEDGSTRVNRKGITVPVTVQTRKFQVFDSERTIEGVVQKGARVFRVAV